MIYRHCLDIAAESSDYLFLHFYPPINFLIKQYSTNKNNGVKYNISCFDFHLLASSVRQIYYNNKTDMISLEFMSSHIMNYYINDLIILTIQIIMYCYYLFLSLLVCFFLKSMFYHYRLQFENLCCWIFYLLSSFDWTLLLRVKDFFHCLKI